MLRFLLRMILSLVLLVLVAAGIGLYLLQDANRFKPELETIIADQTGVPVVIDGDLSWQLLPPLTLSAASISADYEGTSYALGSLQLDINLMSVVRTRDINQWEIKALTLSDLTIAQGTNLTHLRAFRLTDFKPSVASPFKATLTHQSGEAPPLPLEVEGLIAVDPATQELQLTSTRFETTDASGVCDMTATARSTSVASDPEDAIIPVSIWRSVDWSGACKLDRLTLEEENFADVALTMENTGGDSTTDVQIPDFFGGSAGLAMAIDAEESPVQWRIEPDLARADSEALMVWLDKRLKWIAPLAYSGAITMTGNTTEELVHSVQGTTIFDGGKGKIDISQIKQPLLRLATLFQEPEKIASWPDLWDYQRLIGEWVINGTNHQMDFALDNLTAAINGVYDPLTDELDMDVEFLFEDNPDIHSFDVNPVLVGLAIPLSCSGSLEEPACSVNPEATRNLVAAVLTAEQGSEIREKLDQKIEQEVPEEYREAARGLLDLLGKSLKSSGNKE
jgi:hypothetical protein